MTAAQVPIDAFRDLLSSEPAVALSVIDELARRWVGAVAMTKRNAIDVPSRVAMYLSELPKTPLGNDSYAVEIPVARVELAALLNTTPETLSRAFHTLQQRGLIESHDRMIIVPDGKALLAGDNHREPANHGAR